MANSVNMTSKNAAGKEVTKIITDVNPNAADSDISNFVVALASLSNNTLTSIQKIVKENITLGSTVDGTASAETITSRDYGATIDAKGGNDTIIANGAVANSINAGTGNDIISLAGATSQMTIYGGAGYDTIFADNDFRVYGKDTVYSGHLYQFGADDGKDTIVGFNENDTIQITTPGAAVITQWDTTGNHYMVSIGGSSAYIQLKNYGGGKRLNVIDSNGALVSVGTAENGYYIVPKIKQGSTGSDNEGTGKTIINIAQNDGFTVDGLAGNDLIINQGANNVTIYGGAGYDTIQLTTGTVNGSLKYGADVSIDGGAGNDVIIGEFTGGDSLTGSADSNAKPRTFIFGSGDGNDTIYFFSENDSIRLKDANTTVLAASVSGNGAGDDMILNFAPITSTLRATSTMTLVDFAKNKNHAVKIYDADGNLNSIPVPKYVEGTTNSDTLENHSDYYSILAGPGADSIYNTGSNVTIDCATGHNSVVNSGDYVTIDCATGNDSVVNSGDYVTIDCATDSGNKKVISSTGKHNTFKYHPNFSVDVTEPQLSIGAADSSDSLEIFDAHISRIYHKGNDSIYDGDDSIIAVQSLDSINHIFVTGGAMPNLIIEGEPAGLSHVFLDSGTALVNRDNVTVVGNGNVNQIDVTGSNVLVYGNSRNSPTISLGGGAANCTICGANTDDIYWKAVVYSNGNGHYFTAPTTTSREATINNFNINNDVIICSDKQFSASTLSGGDIRIYSGGAMTLTEASSGNIKTVYKGSTKIVEYPLNSSLVTAENSNDSVWVFANFNKPVHFSNSGDFVTVQTGSGNDSISNSGDSASIYSGGGDNFISLGGTANNCTVYAYNGNYDIVNNGQGNIFTAHYQSNSNSTVTGFNTAKDIIAHATSTITGTTVDSDTTLTFTNGSRSQNVFLPGVSSGIIKLIQGSKKGAYLVDSNAVVSYYNDSPSEKITGGSADEVFYNVASDVTISCASGSDTVYNFGDYVTIDGGAADDVINNTGSFVSIYGGAANDQISLGGNAANCTVDCGAGNDNVISNGKGNVFYFRGSTSEGTNTISGFSTANDTIMVGHTGTTITSAVSGNDTTLTLKQSSRTTTVLLPGVSSGNIKVRASLTGGAAGLFTISDGATVRVADLSGGW